MMLPPQWNDLHAEDRHTVLLPVGWDTHASPSMAAPPQEVINRQVLEGCDLLLGIFWTRLGTPTVDARSGTVEEIERHLARGGRAMLYFSDTPVEPSGINADQYAAVQQFRDECRLRGLVETYSSHGEFREKLTRQLTQTVMRDFPMTEAPATGAAVPGIPAGPRRGHGVPRVPPLSREAKVLLYQGSRDPHALGTGFLTIRCLYKPIASSTPNRQTRRTLEHGLRGGVQLTSSRRSA